MGGNGLGLVVGDTIDDRRSLLTVEHDYYLFRLVLLLLFFPHAFFLAPGALETYLCLPIDDTAYQFVALGAAYVLPFTWDFVQD